MESTAAANHILSNILKDLKFLKESNYLTVQSYQEVIKILPTQVEDTVSRPPLPIRKSNSSTTQSTPQTREVALPKLPVRRTNDWTQQAIKLPSPAINPRQAEPEKTSTPPPAYTEQTNPSLATAEALYDYTGEDPATDLSFKQGDIIEVTEYVNDDWWKGSVQGKAGIFPQNHVKKIPPPIKAKRPQPPTKPETNNTPSQINSMPYVYPPPPTTLYQPPPASTPQIYAQPPQPYNQPPQPYNQPQQPVAEHHEEDSKVSNITKKFGGQVATAATWGFGATLGSQAASAIF